MCLHHLRRWESKLVLLREPRLLYHSTKETRLSQIVHGSSGHTDMQNSAVPPPPLQASIRQLQSPFAFWPWPRRSPALSVVLVLTPAVHGSPAFNYPLSCPRAHRSPVLLLYKLLVLHNSLVCLVEWFSNPVNVEEQFNAVVSKYENSLQAT